MDVPTNWAYSPRMENVCQARKMEYEPVMMGMKEPDSFRRLRYTKQILMVMATCVSFASVGMILIWPNVLSSQLTDDNSTIFGNNIYLSDWQMDMVASMMFVGSMPGFLLAGWLVRAIGRRKSILISCIPCIVGAVTIALSYNTYMIIIGRFLDGMSFGMLGVSVRTYVVEIPDPKIRGGACIIVNVLMQIGSIAMLTIGIFLNWYYVVMISGSILVVFCLVIVPFLPESPTYLAVSDRDSEALNVLMRLRGPYADISEELLQLKKLNQTDGKPLEFRDIIKKNILKKLVILLGLFMIANFSGVQVLKANTSRLLEASGLALDKNLSTILVTFVLFIGNFVMMLLVDKLGRRYCLIISLSLIAVAYYSLGTYNFIMDSRSLELKVTRPANATILYETDVSHRMDWSWVPLACLMLAAFGQSTGAGPLPYVLAPEYFPTSMRSQCMSLCTMMSGLQAFATLQLYSPMQFALTQAGVYWTYAASATIGIPYVIFLIRETSGKVVG